MKRMIASTCRKFSFNRRTIPVLLFGSVFLTILFTLRTSHHVDNLPARINSAPDIVLKRPSRGLREQAREVDVSRKKVPSGKWQAEDKPQILDILDQMVVNFVRTDFGNISKNVHRTETKGKRRGYDNIKKEEKGKHLHNVKYGGIGNYRNVKTNNRKKEQTSHTNVFKKLAERLQSLKIFRHAGDNNLNTGAGPYSKERDQLKQMLEGIFTQNETTRFGHNTTRLRKLVDKLIDYAGENGIKDVIGNNQHNDRNFKAFKGLEYPSQVDVKELLLQYKRTRKVTTHTVNKPFNILLNPKVKCQASNDVTEADIFILYIVKTTPEHFDRRYTIRTTWGDERRFPNMRIVFSMGIPENVDLVSKIQSEWKAFSDILFVDYQDTYNNLTLKTISGINWAATHCKAAKYVISVDDDMYVATDFLISYLKEMQLNSSSRLFTGFMYTQSKPIRGKSADSYFDKWILTKKEYPWDEFPSYIFGGFVVMSRATLLEFNFAIRFTEVFIFEDVYLGILANRLGIEATHTRRVNNFKTFTTTESFKHLIASHFYSRPREMRLAWECHRGIVDRNIEKLVYCDIMTHMLNNIKAEISNILSWIESAKYAI